MSDLATIAVNVDFATIRGLTNMTTDQVEEQEGNIDHALFQAFQSEFSEAEEVKACCGYVSSVIVEAHDSNGDPVNVDGARIDRAIHAALSSL